MNNFVGAERFGQSPEIRTFSSDKVSVPSSSLQLGKRKIIFRTGGGRDFVDTSSLLYEQVFSLRVYV
jgi:hypothetical protein